MSPRLCAQMPDAVTLAPGSCLPLVSDAVTPAPGSCLPLVSLCLDARCCDAGSGVVSAACLLVSPISRWLGACFPVCGRMPDAVTLVSLYLDARCCDAGSAVGCQMLRRRCRPLRSEARCFDAWTPDVGSPACLPVSPPVSAVRCQML